MLNDTRPSFSIPPSAFTSTRFHSCHLQIFSHRLGIVREGDLGFFNFGVPLLFPLVAVEALVASGCERLDLHFHRDITASGQHVLSLCAGWCRVLQVCVADPLAKRLECVAWLLMSFRVGVVRVPEQ